MWRPRRCAAVLAIWAILALQARINGEILSPVERKGNDWQTDQGFVAGNERNGVKIYSDRSESGSSEVSKPRDVPGLEVNLGSGWSGIITDLRNVKRHEVDDPNLAGLNSNGDKLRKKVDMGSDDGLSRSDAGAAEVDRQKINSQSNKENLVFGEGSDEGEISNADKFRGERETLIESGESELGGKSFVRDNDKANFYFHVGGVKKIEDLSGRAERRETVINNVKSESLEGSDKKLVFLEDFKNPKETEASKRDGKDSGDFVTSFAKARIFPDDQATRESFNDSKDERNIESGAHGASGNSGGVESASYSRSTDRETSRDKVDPTFVKISNHPIPGADGDAGKTIFNRELPSGLAAVNYVGYIEAEREDSGMRRSPIPEYEIEESSQSPDDAKDMRREGDAVPNASAYPNSVFPHVEIRGSAVRQIGLSQATEIGLIPAQSIPHTKSPAIPSEAPGIRGDPKPRLISDESLTASSSSSSSFSTAGIHLRGEIYGNLNKTRLNEYTNKGEVNAVKKRRGPISGSGNGNETKIIETLNPGGEMVPESRSRGKWTPNVADRVTPNFSVLQPGKSSDGADAPSEPSTHAVKDRSTRIGISNFSGNHSDGDTAMAESRRIRGNDVAKAETAVDPHEKSGGGIFLKSVDLEEGEIPFEKKITAESSEPGALEEKVNRGKNSMSSVNETEYEKNIKVSDTGLAMLDVEGAVSDTTEGSSAGSRGTDVNVVENRPPTTGPSIRNGVTEALNFTVNLLGEKNNDGDLRGKENGRVSRTTEGNTNNTSESETEVVKLSALDITRYEFLAHRHLDAGGKMNDRGAELSGKIVPKVVGDDKAPLELAPYTHREKNSLKYSNNAEAIPAIPLIAGSGDKYLSSKNKRGMKIVGENLIKRFGGTSVPDLESEASESPNVSLEDNLIALNKTEKRMEEGSTPFPVGYTGGEEKDRDPNSRHLSRSFTSSGEAGTRSKSLGQSEQLFPENEEEEEKKKGGEHGRPVTPKEDFPRSENITGMNFPNRNESPFFRALLGKNRTATDGRRRVITTSGNETYSDNGNEGTIRQTDVIAEEITPLNLDSENGDVLSALAEELLSTETPTKTTLDIFQAFTHSLNLNLNPSFNFNQTDLENVSRGSTPSNQWPVKHSAVVEGDLVLGGLMMVHEREDTVTCGPVMPQGGVQALEAMLYTLDRFNEMDLIPGVKIGAHILDDCDKDTYGLEMAVDFIKGSISNIDGAEYHCNKTAVRKVISGVVGAASSVTSIQVANLLRLFRIPQVSFFSTSPELSNKQRFEYFTRTIPSDHYQVKAMVDIIRKMNWSYVSIIYEESNYGIKAFEELEALFIQNNICIAIKEKLIKDSGVPLDNAYDTIVQKLLTKPRARGCIIFGSDQEVAGLMRAVGRNNATGAFSWIGSDGWSARGLVSDGNEPVVEGTLSVQPQANPIKGFEEYFLDLTVENNRRNPWFVVTPQDASQQTKQPPQILFQPENEFWENKFQCRYPNSSLTPYNVNYTEPCTTKERLKKNDTAFENQLQFVSDAVMAFAYAFRNMHRDLCPEGKRGLCDKMKPIKGTELLKYLKNVTFEGLSGDEFRFDKNGDGPARYNIFNFKQVSHGKYEWVRVGEYMEGELRLNMSEIKFRMGHPMPPESVCSLPCEVGQAKKYVEGESCCWHCFNCTQYQIRDPLDEERCFTCPQGSLPDNSHSKCDDIPEEFLKPESGWAIGAMSFSATGILVTLFIGGVFLKYDDTPVVRASGRESSYVLLTGILLCYLVTFALVLRPDDIVCGIQRFGAGFCFTVVYAALLTKTNRISRIFNAGRHSAQRPPFTSPRSQLIICSGLVGVQILVNGVWMIIDPAKAMHHYPTKEDNLLVCNSYIDASYMIAFAYPIILIIVCTVYAVLTREMPEDYNESKHIGFTMYTTCVIWLAFVPLYFGTGNHVALRITSMSVTISLSASVTIACLFSPKLYIILLHPERNVRQSMMRGRYGTNNSSAVAVTGTNASCMMAPLTVCAVTSDQNKAVKRYVTTTIDGSTQSDEHYEMEVKEDRSNGKAHRNLISRSTQASATELELKSTKDGITISKDIVKDSIPQENKQVKNVRIGNGPVSQKDGPL